MAMTQASSALPNCVVIDANVPIAIAANELGAPNATSAINHYLAQQCDFSAPGAIVAEVLYVLCGKEHDGSLTASEYQQAIEDFALFMSMVNSPPGGDGSLVRRVAGVRGTYTCRRSADGIYIALAEALATSYRTVLLTLDENMAKQSACFARNHCSSFDSLNEQRFICRQRRGGSWRCRLRRRWARRVRRC